MPRPETRSISLTFSRSYRTTPSIAVMSTPASSHAAVIASAARSASVRSTSNPYAVWPMPTTAVRSRNLGCTGDIVPLPSLHVRGRAVVASTLAAVAAAAVVASPAARGSAGLDPNPALRSSQGCLDAGVRSAAIPWQRLRNPILSYRSSALRDEAVRFHGGRWHVLFTDVVGDPARFRLGGATSRNLRTWSAKRARPTQPHALETASPDITRRSDGTYVVTYQARPGDPSPTGQNKIWYRLSSDLVHWGSPHRLIPHLHSKARDRLIDAALAWTQHGLFLGYKYNAPGAAQHFEIAWSPSGSLDGPWRYVGRPNISVYNDTVENYEFLEIDGVWSLLATSNTLDRPEFFQLRGNPARPMGWLDWSPARELEIPLESWNRAVGIPGGTFDEANSAYLCDARAVDGWFYLFYIGSTELRSFSGWGHTKLGVARSKDLVVWEVPCPASQVSTFAGCQPS